MCGAYMCAKWPSLNHVNIGIHSIILHIRCSFQSDYLPIKIKLMRANAWSHFFNKFKFFIEPITILVWRISFHCIRFVSHLRLKLFFSFLFIENIIKPQNTTHFFVQFFLFFSFRSIALANQLFYAQQLAINSPFSPYMCAATLKRYSRVSRIKKQRDK